MLRTILSIISAVFLETELGIFSVVTAALFLVGLWGIFAKCGVKPAYALLPGYRYYELARCADQEPQGRIWYVLHMLYIVENLLRMFLRLDGAAETILLLCLIPLRLGMVLYSLQIYLSLTAIFQRRRLWILLWIIEPAIPALLWGFDKNYQPEWKVDALEQQKEVIISGNQVKAMDTGMTINLEERAVPDFFKKKYLLRDIHMYIPPKHMVLLLGGSGAGKSTLVNAMNGYEKAKAEIVLNGSNLYSEYKKMQYEIGFVPQQELMRGRDTVYHTLMDAAALRLPNDFSLEDRKKRVHEVMHMFGLLPVQRSMVEKLSGGQKKRLSIAMEFIPNPSLFILDEPDSGLDGVMARELMEQLRRIADMGTIIVVITHTPDRVIDLFDDVIVLAKDANRTGRLAYFGPIEEAKTYFGADDMEKIVMKVNRQEEGGEGRADEFITKFAEVQHG